MQAFISRTQTPDSEFSSLLRAAGWQVYGQSLVTLQALPFDRIPDCDWIFFASKNAVHFFFRQVAILNISLPQVRWAAMGSATAEVLAKHVETIHFRGTGAPASTAIAFLGETDSAKPAQVLFPAARHSMRSIAVHLGDTIQPIHLEVYDNQPIKYPPQRNDEVLVFTSPMNARTYFFHFPLLPFQKVVAIGATTTEALRQLGIKIVITAAAANERSLAEAVIAQFGAQM